MVTALCLAPLDVLALRVGGATSAPLRADTDRGVIAGRRAFGSSYAAATAAAATLALGGRPGAARAFDNALPEQAKYSDRPKRRGPMAKDLGLAVRPGLDADGDVVDDGLATALKPCRNAPNCFSTTADVVAIEQVRLRGS